MSNDLPRAVAEAYRWQRRLGHAVTVTPHCQIVANPAYPAVWDANHADAVTATTQAEIDAVFAAMDTHLAHTPWRVVHTDAFTPDAFLARLMLEDFEERPVTIQMALEGAVTDRGAAVTLHPVTDDADWAELRRLVRIDHVEGRRTGDLDLSEAFTDAAVADYRAKGAAFAFHLAILDGAPVAYGARAAAPGGVGMIEDLFTLPAARRRGIATGLIAAFVHDLRAQGCHTIFLGALASEAPKRLYARLGFRPVGLARAFVRRVSPAVG